MKLSVVLVSLEDGMILISQEEVRNISKKWECCLSGYIPGLNPHLPSLMEFLIWRWDITGSLDLIARGKSSFLLWFSEKEERDRVLKKKVYSVSGHPFLLKEWSPGDPGDDLVLDEIPVGIQIRGFPVHLWDGDIFAKIATALGKPISVDRQTKEAIRLEYARLCVAMSPLSAFPDELKLKVSNGDVIPIAIKYEWRPNICTHCKHFGHDDEVCHLAPIVNSRDKPAPKKTSQRWTPVKKNISKLVVSSEMVENSELAIDDSSIKALVVCQPASQPLIYSLVNEGVEL